MNKRKWNKVKVRQNGRSRTVDVGSRKEKAKGNRTGHYKIKQHEERLKSELRSQIMLRCQKEKELFKR